MGRGRGAIVIGAGTTGLLMAAALSRHFANVTVLERDALPTSPHWRKGSPQSPHVHVLLKRGADIMQKYLPGALDDIARAGGHRIDMSLDTDWFYAGGWKARLPSGITMHSQSKGLLEFTLAPTSVAGTARYGARALPKWTRSCVRRSHWRGRTGRRANVFTRT